MTRTAINLYTVRDLQASTLDVLELVADAGYDGVQFSGGLGDATPLEVVDALAELELAVTPPHVGLETLEADYTDVRDTYANTLGCDGFVVPWLDPADVADAEAVDATAERLAAVCESCAGDDLDLLFHNHDHEFTDVGDETAYERLLERTRSLRFELDVGWAKTGGMDPVTLIERYGERMPLIHMKDMTANGEFAEIGEGVVDMAACADAARAAGADWLIYEHDDPEDPRRSIETGARFLESL